MKRVLAVLSSSLVLFACGAEEVGTAAGVRGAHDIEHVGGLLLVTSSERDELRALDLTSNPPMFVQAPNPLNALGIPVLNRPVDIATQVTFEDAATPFEDRIGAGRFAFVRGAASPAISIVDTDPSVLREIRRIELGELGVPAATVTAIAARAAEGATPAKLYFATYDGSTGRVYELTIPDDAALAGSSLEAPVALGPLNAALLTYPGDTVNALLVLPGDRLAIARRRLVFVDGAQRSTGATEVVTVATGAVLPLAFPFPVKTMETHPTMGLLAPIPAGQPEPAPLEMPAGARIYAVLDEEACGGALECSGVLAVDTISASYEQRNGRRLDLNAGQVSLDDTGLPMLTLHPHVSGALVTDLEIAKNVVSLAPAISAEGQTVPTISVTALLGTFTTADPRGEVMLFDALQNKHINFAGEAATPAVTEVLYAAPNGTTRLLDPATAPVSISAFRGIGRDEIVAFTFEGIVPGFLGLPRDPAAATTFAFPPALADRVQVSDRVLLAVGQASCELSIGAIDPAAGTFTSAEAVPAECASATTYTVRASGAQPFVVTGRQSPIDFDTVAPTGFIGRLGVGQSLREPVQPYYRVGTLAPPQPLIELRGPIEADIIRGAEYQARLESNFRPYWTALASTNYGTISSIVYVDRIPVDDGTERFGNYFFAHPATPASRFQFGALTEVTPTDATPSQPATPLARPAYL